MFELNDRAALERLIADKVPESLTLDYKESRALNKNNNGRTELVKDVTAFANSAVGQIIYGIPERDKVPQPLDSGVNSNDITREWIEQVIHSRSSPRIHGLRIHSIELDPAQPQVSIPRQSRGL